MNYVIFRKKGGGGIEAGGLDSWPLHLHHHLAAEPKQRREGGGVPTIACNGKFCCDLISFY